MPSDFSSSTKPQFAQVSDPKIRPNNLNRNPFAESLASYPVPQPSGSIRATNFSCYCFTATGAIHSPGSVLVASNKPYSYHPHGDSISLELFVDQGLFLATTQATDLAEEWIDERVISLQL